MAVSLVGRRKTCYRFYSLKKCAEYAVGSGGNNVLDEYVKRRKEASVHGGRIQK